MEARLACIKKAIVLFACILFLFSMCGCPDSGKDYSGAEGVMTGNSTCKGSNYTDSGKDIPSDQDCIQYAYDKDQTLYLQQINAGFNCCPGEFSAEIAVSKGRIVIHVSEEHAICNCNCLFDLDFEIMRLPAGIYVIEVIEDYKSDNDEPLIFTADLMHSTHGTWCVKRTTYPWGE